MTPKSISTDSTLWDSVRQIELTHSRISVVTFDNGLIAGTLTDGDIRRHLLAGGALEDSVTLAMNKSPIIANISDSPGYIQDLMRTENVLAIPLINECGKYIQLAHITEFDPSNCGLKAIDSIFSFALIMAGGEGKRLRPLTENIPKPMISLHGSPIMERQIRRLADVGIKKIYISVNYLGDVIEEYFKDGSDLGVKIVYLRETQQMGTAGALNLLPESPDKPFIVMNGDIMTKSDFLSLSRFHLEQSADLTIGTVAYRVKIPYGVVNLHQGRVIGLEEKPTQKFMCNAGIYVLSPKILTQLTHKNYFDMTDLIDISIKLNKRVVAFPIHEYWSDIGTPDDLEQARKDYSKWS